jgi:RNA polymerase sigma-70 factor (ECF subfamily)
MFPTTRWTLVLRAREGTEERRTALDQLLGSYWKPLYFYVRRKGLQAADAEDAVQGLFAQLLEHDFPRQLDPARGRLRGFLKTAMDNHLLNLHERATAQKRGGGQRLVSLDFVLAEREIAATCESAEMAFDREWALAIMQRSLARLRQEYEAGRRRGDVETILRFFSLEEAPSYAEAARASGMTATQFKAALHRARARFRELVREEVLETVAESADAEQELAELFRVLSA